MKELWIKKTIYRRYLIDDDEVEIVESILKNDPVIAEELIDDIYDKNKDIEYDEEKLILPVCYSIKNINNEKPNPTMPLMRV